KTVKRKVMSMYTDPKRIRADIPGRMQGNPVFIYHDAFNDDRAEVEDLKARYRKGKVGDVEVKQKLIAALNRFLEPIRERRARFAAEKGLVEAISGAALGSVSRSGTRIGPAPGGGAGAVAVQDLAP